MATDTWVVGPTGDFKTLRAALMSSKVRSGATLLLQAATYLEDLMGKKEGCAEVGFDFTTPALGTRGIAVGADVENVSIVGNHLSNKPEKAEPGVPAEAHDLLDTVAGEEWIHWDSNFGVLMEGSTILLLPDKDPAP